MIEFLKDSRPIELCFDNNNSRLGFEKTQFKIQTKWANTGKCKAFFTFVMISYLIKITPISEMNKNVKYTLFQALHINHICGYSINKSSIYNIQEK